MPTIHFSNLIRIFLLQMLCIALCHAVFNVQGQVLYWDPEGTTATGGNENGNWNTNNVWSSTSALTTNLVAWSNGAVAYFSAGTTVAEATVFVQGTPSISGLYNRLGVSVSGALSIQGNPLNLVSGSNILNVYVTNSSQFETDTTTIGSQLTGPGLLVLEGTGYIILTNANNYTGGTQFGEPGSNNTSVDVQCNGNCFGTGPITLAGGGAGIATTGVRATISNAFNIEGGVLQVPEGTVFSGPWNLAQTLFFVTADEAPYATISGPISGSGGIVLTGYETSLILGGTNTYTGPTVISNSTHLELSSTGSISNSSSISIGVGCLFDVSRISSFVLSSNTSFVAMGSGVDSAQIFGASGGTVNLLSQPVILSYMPASFSGDPSHESLYLSSGSLILSNNPVTITNATSTPLGPGIYDVMQVAAPGTIIGAPNPSVSVLGAGLASNTVACLAVVGGTIDLIVSPPVSSPPEILSQLASNSFQLTSASVPNAAFVVQSATNLTPPVAWSNISATTANSNGLIQFSVTNLNTNSAAFYRLAFP